MSKQQLDYYDKYPDPTRKALKYIIGIVICLCILVWAFVH